MQESPGTDTIVVHILPHTRERNTNKHSTSGKPKHHLFPSRRPPGYSKHIKQIVKDYQEADEQIQLD